MVTIKSSQKIFTEEEISRLTGVCLDHLRTMARSRHLGSRVVLPAVSGGQTEARLFTHSDLMVVAVLLPRCEHEI